MSSETGIASAPAWRLQQRQGRRDINTQAGANSLPPRGRRFLTSATASTSTDMHQPPRGPEASSLPRKTARQPHAPRFHQPCALRQHTIHTLLTSSVQASPRNIPHTVTHQAAGRRQRAPDAVCRRPRRRGCARWLPRLDSNATPCHSPLSPRPVISMRAVRLLLLPHFILRGLSQVSGRWHGQHGEGGQVEAWCMVACSG